MKKIKISEDLVPLSRRQQTVFNLIIVCVFQFLLFFTPVLAAEAVAKENLSNNSEVSIGFSIKGEADPVVAALIASAQKAEETEIDETPFVGPKNHVLPASEEATPEVRVISTSIRTITAYNSVPEQTDSTPCITANGFDVCKHWTEDTIAANFLKFGTKVRIPELFGDRIFIVRDRMNKRFSDRVDVWMKEVPDARKFGKRTAYIEVVEVIE
jgi:3D (Asp-Asp-Asp) domain-containing protein